jgi:hypothetical protein
VFCPKCKAEYVAGITTCRDCQVDLVDVLPEPGPKARRGAARAGRAEKAKMRRQLAQPLQLVTVLKTPDPGQALLAEALLCEAAVRFISRGGVKQGSGGWGGITDLIGGSIELQVRGEDAERAQDVLRDLQSYDQEAADDAGES